jgi:hypothetical protein
MIFDATQGGWQAGLNAELAATLLVAALAMVLIAWLFIAERITSVLKLFAAAGCIASGVYLLLQAFA